MSDNVKRTIIDTLLHDWADDLAQDKPEQPVQPTQEQELATELDEINSLGEQLERELHGNPKKRKELAAHLEAKLKNWQERQKPSAPPANPERERQIADLTNELNSELQKLSREADRQKRKELRNALRKLVVGE